MKTSARIVSIAAAAALASPVLAGIPAANADMQFFTSPSGNVACLSDAEWVRCDIRQRVWSPPPRPADCSNQTGFGQGIMLNARGGAQFVCAGDTTFGSNARVLQYGQRLNRGSYSCASETAGISCRNAAGRGFMISREAYRIF